MVNKSSSRNNKKRKATRRRGNGRSLTQGLVQQKAVSVPRNPLMVIRRSTQRSLSYNPAGGIDAGGQYTMQLTFAPGATDYRLGGVSIYSDALPNNTEFSQLFDQYRVAGVTVRIDLNPNAYANSGVSFTPPIAYFIADYDDPQDASVVACLQYPQVITHSWSENGYKPFIAHLKPKPLRDVAGAGIATGYSPMSSAPFIRTSEMTVPHYGLKMALVNNGASVNAIIGYFLVNVFYDLEFINPK